MLVNTIPEDFNELFEDRSLAAIALLRKFRRIMIMAVDMAFVFVVAVGCAEDSGTYTACEMLDVVFSI